MEDELKVKIKVDTEANALKDFNSSLKLLAGSTKPVKSGLAEVEKGLTGASNGAKKAKGGISEVEKGLTGVGGNSKKAKGALNEVGKGLTEVGGASKKTKKDLDDVGKGLTGVGKNGKVLNGAGKGLTGIGAGAKGAIGGVNSLSGAFAGLATTMLPVLSVAAVLGFAKASLEAFGNFEKGMNQIFTLLPAKSAEAEKAMGDKVQNTMKKFGLTAEDTTTAVYNALSAGVPEDNVFKFIEDSAKSAKAGGASLDDAASVITTVMNNFRSSNLDSLHVSDLLFATVKKGVTTFPELASSIGDVLPSMNSARVSFEQTSATMATLTATMGKGSTAKAGTALRAMIDELNNSSTKTSQTFKQLAGKDFKTFMQNGGDLSQAIGLMKGKADSMKVSVADLFQSIEAKKAVNILNDNKKVFDENLESFKNVNGATDEAYNKMNRGWAAMSSRMKAGFEVDMIKFGDAIAPFAEIIGGALMLGIEALAVSFDILGKAVDFVLAPFKELQSAWEFIGNMGAKKGAEEMAKSMEGLSPAAQAAVPGILEIKDKLTDLGTGIMETFEPVTSKVSEFFQLLTGGAGDGSSAMTVFVDLLIAGIDALTPYLLGLADYASNVFGVILDVLGVVGGFYLSMLSSMGISTSDVSAVLQSLGVIGGAVFSTLGTAISTAWGIIKPILEPLLALLGQIVGALAKISFNALKEGAGFVAGLLGGGKGAPPKKNALGTESFAGGSTTISEQGKELFATPSGLIGISPNERSEMSLPAGTQIFSNKKTRSIMETAKNLYNGGASAPVVSGGGTTAVNVNMPINIANATPQQVDRIKSLMPAIKAMIENVLADRDSDYEYRMGAM